MTKLFDNVKAAKVKKQRTAQIAVYVCICVILITTAILFAVFYKRLSRGIAQSVSSVCFAVACAYSLIFADYMVYYKKILDICRAEKSYIEGRVKYVDDKKTTYRSLTCRIVEVILSDGGERRLYMYNGELTVDKVYKIEIAQNIIGGYEEIL